MAIRSDEITSIIKSAIDQFDPGVETRSVGPVVEVGDGVAQMHGLAGALAGRAGPARTSRGRPGSPAR